jgi:hypothetical protein
MTTSYSMQGTGSDGSTLSVSAVYTAPSTPPPPTGPTFPTGANTAKIGTAPTTIVLSGINPTAESNPNGVGFAGFRGPGQAVIYTTGTLSPANQWGVEFQCDTNGVIVGVNDRATTGDVNGTPIPSGGYVFSVHDDGDPAGNAAYARTWGVVGATIVITTVTGGGGGTDPVPPTGGAVAWPLKVSSDGRRLVDQNNVPYLVTADTAWTAFSALNETDAKHYVDIKKGQGFNTLLCLTTDWGRQNAETPAAGYPFNNGDVTSPIESYWQRFDRLIDYAAANNMLVFVGVLALSSMVNGSGGGFPTNAQAQTYATWLANRYKSKGNIVWFLGGDAQYEANASFEDALFNALKTADAGTHLITFHPSWDNYNLSTSWPVSFNSIQWNDTNTPYSFDKAKTGYQQGTTRPFFNMEPPYFPSPALNGPVSRLRNRQDAWWTITQGALGVAYGGYGDGTWSIGHKGATPNWTHAADVTGNDVGNVRKVLEQYHWERLVPSYDSTVVTSRSSGLNYITVARATDGSLIVAFTPTGAAITVDLSKLSAAGTAQWFDPSTGLASGNPTNVGNTGQQTFTPPTANSVGDHDWVLILKSGATTPPGGGTGTPLTITERTPVVTEVTSGTSVQAALPTLTDQDTAVVWASVPGTSVSQLTEPAGWSRIIDPFTVPDLNIVGAWYKRHSTASPVTAPTISTSAAAGKAAAIATALVGVDATNPLDVAAQWAMVTASSNSVAQSLTTQNDGAYVISGGVLDSSSQLFASAPSGMSVTATSTGGSQGRGMSLASQTLATAGASGSKAWGSAGGLGLGTFLAAFRPGGSAGGGGGGGGTPPPSTGAWSLSCYGMVWSDSPSINFNTGLDPSFTDFNVSFANSSGGKPGGLVGDGPQGLTATKSQIAALRARGVKVKLSFGGGGYGVSYPSASTFLANLQASANYYGLTMWDGIDWDDEGTFNGPQAVALSRAAKQAFGTTFKVTWAPNGATVDAYINAVRGNLDVVDEFGQQFYDSNVSYSAALSRVDQMRAAGIPTNKIAIGMMLGNDSNHWTMAQCKQYMTQFRSDRGIRRAYLWEIGNNSAAWGQAMKAIVQ